MSTSCWLFFDAGTLTVSEFIGHTHDVAYIGDCPVTGYVVPCTSCLYYALQSGNKLVYDNTTTPINQSGVTEVPA